MNPLVWDPPGAVVAVLGLLALLAWLVFAPPGRSVRGALRAAAAVALLLALFDVGCRGDADRGGRLIVLLDRSRSMDVAEPGEPSRADAAQSWLASAEFATWAEGWDVRIDSFGGATTDVAGALEAAASEGPDAIVLLSDGRAAHGRAAEPVGVPLFVRVPRPARIADLAIVDLGIEPEEGSTHAVVTVAAVGGAPWSSPRRVEVRVDGALAGRAEIEPPVASGERREVSVRLPGGRPGTRRVEARLEPGDAVEANDRRTRMWDVDEGPNRILVVGLAPLWEMAAFRRAFEVSVDAPVDAVWGIGEGPLRSLAGEATAWRSLSRDRVRVAAVFGDPARLGSEGEEWLRRFASAGGRALLWAPQGYGGRLAGLELDVASGSETGRPELTGSGRAWLVRRGALPGAVPDGGEAWPPLERLPATSPDPGSDAVPILAAGDRPVAWVGERDAIRWALLLGTGVYRWPLSGPGPARFWEAWSEALARWLVAAEATERPLVRLPDGRRVTATETETRIGRVVGEDRPVAWRIEGEEAGIVAEGEIARDEPAEIRAGPLEPGTYRLVVEIGGRRTREPFVVEPLVPDLAWTAADTVGVVAAARASGGGRVGESPGATLPDPSVEPDRDGSRGLASLPWAYLAAAILLLADWGIGVRRARSGASGAETSRSR